MFRALLHTTPKQVLYDTFTVQLEAAHFVCMSNNFLRSKYVRRKGHFRVFKNSQLAIISSALIILMFKINRWYRCECSMGDHKKSCSCDIDIQILVSFASLIDPNNLFSIAVDLKQQISTSLQRQLPLYKHKTKIT